MNSCREYSDDAIVVLSPRYHIRPNRDYCVIYPFDPVLLGSWRRVPAFEGIVLSLLDGKRTLKDVANMISFLFDVSFEMGREIVRSSIMHSNKVSGAEFLEYASSSNNTKEFSQYPPMEFIKKLNGDYSGHLSEIDRFDTPLSLLLMPSNRCAVNCIYCYSERRYVPLAEHLSIERWCQIIDEAHDLGIDLIIFGGGDPLTYEGIEVLFNRLVNYQMKFLLSTKAFISKKRARWFSEANTRGMATIQISIDGMSTVADKMVRSPGYVNRAFQSINNLIEQGCPVRTNTVCTPLNLEEVPALVMKLHDLGVETVGVTNYSRSFYWHDDSLFLSSGQIDWLNTAIKRIKDELDWHGLRCNAAVRDFSISGNFDRQSSWENRPHCSGGTSSIVITPDGKVVLCEQVPQRPPFFVGDLKNRSIRDIWYSQEVLSFILPSKDLFVGSVCHACNEFDSCHRIYGRCFRDALFTYDSLYAPPPNCPQAPIGLRMS